MDTKYILMIFSIMKFVISADDKLDNSEEEFVENTIEVCVSNLRSSYFSPGLNGVMNFVKTWERKMNNTKIIFVEEGQDYNDYLLDEGENSKIENSDQWCDIVHPPRIENRSIDDDNDTIMWDAIDYNQLCKNVLKKYGFTEKTGLQNFAKLYTGNITTPTLISEEITDINLDCSFFGDPYKILLGDKTQNDKQIYDPKSWCKNGKPKVANTTTTSTSTTTITNEIGNTYQTAYA